MSERIDHVDHSSLSDRSDNSAPRNTSVVAPSRSIDNDYIVCDGEIGIVTRVSHTV